LNEIQMKTTDGILINVMNISDIKYAEPIREMGDLTDLIETMPEVGLINPITVTEDGTLLAGRRRFAAAKKLGWDEIPVHILDPKDEIERVLIEYYENVKRKSLTDAENRRYIAKIDALMREKFGSSPTGVRKDRRSESEHLDETWSVQKTADKLGISKGSISEAKTAVKFEDEHPELKKLDLPTPIIIETKKAPESVLSEVKKEIVRQAEKLVKQAEKKKKIEHKEIKRIIKEKKKEKSVEEFDDSRLTSNIVCDSIENLMKYVEPNSVDLILTDPPYPREYLPLWGILFKKALECLKDGGLLVAYTPHIYIPEICDMIPEGLNYVWIIAQIHSGSAAAYHPSKVNIRWKPILVFVKDKIPEHIEYYDDILQGAGREKEEHEWQQAVGEAEELIERFSRIGDFIVEPFLGSGTTVVAAKRKDRSFFGLDIDKSCVVTTIKRLEDISNATIE